MFSEPCLYGIDGVIPAPNLVAFGRYLPMACKFYKLILCQRHYCYCSDTNNGKQVILKGRRQQVKLVGVDHFLQSNE